MTWATSEIKQRATDPDSGERPNGKEMSTNHKGASERCVLSLGLCKAAPFSVLSAAHHFKKGKTRLGLWLGKSFMDKLESELGLGDQGDFYR